MEKNLFNNTLLIFTGDNGTGRSVISSTVYGNIPGGKGLSINTGNHVPMVISWPEKISKPFVFKNIVDFSDILPTLADAADIEPSKYETDGMSFYNVLSGKQTRMDKKEIFIHYSPRWGKYEHARWVMDGHYKLYHDGRFYNTANDPFENNEITNPSKKKLKIKNRFQTILAEKEEEFPFSRNDQ
jgi:arylsulfatase A